MIANVEAFVRNGEPLAEPIQLFRRAEAFETMLSILDNIAKMSLNIWSDQTV